MVKALTAIVRHGRHIEPCQLVTKFNLWGQLTETEVIPEWIKIEQVDSDEVTEWSIKPGHVDIIILAQAGMTLDYSAQGNLTVVYEGNTLNIVVDVENALDIYACNGHCSGVIAPSSSVEIFEFSDITKSVDWNNFDLD